MKRRKTTRTVSHVPQEITEARPSIPQKLGATCVLPRAQPLEKLNAAPIWTPCCLEAVVVRELVGGGRFGAEIQASKLQDICVLPTHPQMMCLSRADWDREKTFTSNYQKNGFVSDPNAGFGRNKRRPAELEVRVVTVLLCLCAWLFVSVCCSL